MEAFSIDIWLTTESETCWSTVHHNVLQNVSVQARARPRLQAEGQHHSMGPVLPSAPTVALGERKSRKYGPAAMRGAAAAHWNPFLPGLWQPRAADEYAVSNP